MPHHDLFHASDELARELSELVDDLELLTQSPRLVASAVAVSLAREHWDAVRPLLAARMLSSAVVVHRAQFEAITRSVWLTYAATEDDVRKLSANLNLATEQSAKNMPSVAEMMGALNGKAPSEAVKALSRFKDTSWRALTSYAHAGIHAISRHSDGYPRPLIENLLRNANGLGLLCYFQVVGICGRQALQADILASAAKFSSCLPEPFDGKP